MKIFFSQKFQQNLTTGRLNHLLIWQTKCSYKMNLIQWL